MHSCGQQVMCVSVRVRVRVRVRVHVRVRVRVCVFARASVRVCVFVCAWPPLVFSRVTADRRRHGCAGCQDRHRVGSRDSGLARPPVHPSSPRPTQAFCRPRRRLCLYAHRALCSAEPPYVAMIDTSRDYPRHVSKMNRQVAINHLSATCSPTNHLSATCSCSICVCKCVCLRSIECALLAKHIPTR